MSRAEEKAALRKEIKSRLKELRQLESIYWDQSILAGSRFMELKELQQAGTVLAFVSYGTEIDTDPLIESLLSSGRNVALPRTTGETMTFHLLPPEATEDTWKNYLELGDFGILVPPEMLPVFDPATATADALCVLPGLAFDEAGHRLGKGKGFYDRYLSTCPTLPTIGFAFDLQIVPSVPVEDHDHSCTAIVTDLQVIYPATGTTPPQQ